MTKTEVRPEFSPQTPKEPDIESFAYEELKRLARSVAASVSGSPVSASTLVHEVWMKFRMSRNLKQISELEFKGLAATAMRSILRDAVRRRRARKRGGDAVIVPLADSFDGSCQQEFTALDDALSELNGLEPRQAKVVELRYFSGLSVPETAKALNVAETTVERDWRKARAWLRSAMRKEA